MQTQEDIHEERKEQHKLSLIRTIVDNRDPSVKEVDDLTLRRFLRARYLDVEKAAGMFLRTFLDEFKRFCVYSLDKICSRMPAGQEAKTNRSNNKYSVALADSQVDIAYASFVERFQPLLLELKNYDITSGRPKVAKWIEELNKVDAYKQAKWDINELTSAFKRRVLVRHLDMKAKL